MSELLSVLKSHGVANDEANRMLGTLDANDDSTVHYTEFLAAMMTHSIATNEGHIRAAFNRLDRDNSGSITLENLKATLGETYGGMDMETILKEVDTHNTGYISFDEFMAYLQGGDAEQLHLEFVGKIAEEEKKQVPQGERNIPAPQQQAGLASGDVSAAATASVIFASPLASEDAAPVAAPAAVAPQADTVQDAPASGCAVSQSLPLQSAPTSGFESTASLQVNTSQTQVGYGSAASLYVNTSQTQAGTAETTPLVDPAPKAQTTSQCCSVM